MAFFFFVRIMKLNGKCISHRNYHVIIIRRLSSRLIPTFAEKSISNEVVEISRCPISEPH